MWRFQPHLQPSLWNFPWFHLLKKRKKSATAKKAKVCIVRHVCSRLTRVWFRGEFHCWESGLWLMMSGICCVCVFSAVLNAFTLHTKNCEIDHFLWCVGSLTCSTSDKSHVLEVKDQSKTGQSGQLRTYGFDFLLASNTFSYMYFSSYSYFQNELNIKKPA